MKVDEQFKCKDCDNYNLCKYYHNRRETSFICKEFQNQWGFIKELEKLKVKVIALSYDCKISTVDRYEIEKLIDKRITELKGE